MQTVLVKKPEDREILELVDAECLYYESRSESGMCTAPPGHKCPYREYGRSLPTAQSDKIVKYGGLSRSLPLRLTSTRSRPGSGK